MKRAMRAANIGTVRVLCALALAASCLSTGRCDLPHGRTGRILVVVDADEVLRTHSRLLNSLQDKGFELDRRLASEDDLPILSDGEYLYDGIALLCPTAAGMEKKLPLSHLTRFVDAGNSLFLAASHKYSKYTGKVAESIGLDLSHKSHMMIDHHNVAEVFDDESHTFINAGGRSKSHFLFGDAASPDAGPIVFSGPGATLFTDNELIDSVIWGSGSSFAHSPSEPIIKVPRIAGSGSVLAGALSTRVGSRAVYFGSMDALSDAVFDVAGNAHETAMTSLFAWTYGYTGVLRTANVLHSSEESTGAASRGYRVKDIVSFSIDIQSWNGNTSSWLPYEADDVQIEFTMMNPWVRTRLSAVGNSNGTFTATIPVPDQIGVYKFSIQYFRPGVSPISMQEVVPVRPFFHNEYERFIPMAFPYYVSSFSMLIGVCLLGLVLLYGGTAGVVQTKID